LEKEDNMKRILMLSIVFLFFVGTINAQGVRDDDSYRIYFEWNDDRSNPPGGVGYFDEDIITISISGAKLTEGFNVYAKNNSPAWGTGDPISDHSAYPEWYALMGWDVPDFDYYFLVIDTHAETWGLFYVDYGRAGSALDGQVNRVNIPMSGITKLITLNGDNSVDIDLEEIGGNWKVWWGGNTPWDYENVRLQDKHFIAHIDFNNKTGYIVPRQLVPEEE